MRQGRIYTADELDADMELSCDVCIVGSGPGGAWLAHELVSRGRSVVMLEEGPYRTARDFDLTERTAFANLYQEVGNRGTDDLAVKIFQGRSVGGGTTVNWCSSFRTPERILQLWRERHGLSALTPEALAPHFDAIERRLHIAEWPEAAMNRSNRVLWDGLGALGYSRGLIKRNVHNCANLGYCGMGCALEAKQSMGVTVLPDAVEKGLSIYANVSARRLRILGRRVVEVQAEVLDSLSRRPTGVAFRVRAKVTAACCGALNTPALLLRSALTGGGRVGRRTFLHPLAAMLAVFDEPVNAHSGAPQAVYSHHFLDRGPDRIGFFLEAAPIHPVLAATVGTFTGADQLAIMARLPNLQATIGLAADGILPGDEGGTVGIRDQGFGRLAFDYPLSEATFEALREACKQMARVQFAAGAREVYSLHSHPVRLRSIDDLPRLDAAPWERLRLRIATAHPLGGCAMGADPATSVLDPHLRYRELDNLFVVDGSAFPTSLGVNPQESIMGLSRWAAQHVDAAIG